MGRPTPGPADGRGDQDTAKGHSGRRATLTWIGAQAIIREGSVGWGWGAEPAEPAAAALCRRPSPPPTDSRKIGERTPPWPRHRRHVCCRFIFSGTGDIFEGHTVAENSLHNPNKQRKLPPPMVSGTPPYRQPLLVVCDGAGGCGDGAGGGGKQQRAGPARAANTTAMHASLSRAGSRYAVAGDMR